MAKTYRKTPLMGWASWNAFRSEISEEIIKKQADVLVNSGLAECGYVYLNTDDGFFGGRGADGRLRFHPTKFPNGIKVIADYAHEKGLKAGIYSEGGDKTCCYYFDGAGENGVDVGLHGHEREDLTLFFEECGFDFIKVDWCGGIHMGLNEQEQFTKIGRIVDELRERTGKPLVYNVCRWQFPGEWVLDIADSWRTGADITPDFTSILNQIDNLKPLKRFCKPGHINDPDMMQIGNGLSETEEKTHFAMWCMLCAPLMIGCDLRTIPDKTLELLKNKELIAIDQDAACLQAFVTKEFRGEDGTLNGELWVKLLGDAASSERAVVLLNRSDKPLTMAFDLKDVGLAGKVTAVRDLWQHTDLPCSDRYEMTVAPHDCVALRISAERAVEVADVNESKALQCVMPTRINYEQAKELVANGARLLDVRHKEEFDAWHLPHAEHFCYLEIHALHHLRLSQDETIVAYCKTGKRCFQSAHSLAYLGYPKVYYLSADENDG